MKILLIKNIGLLATPLGSAARSGAAQGEIRLLRDAWVRVEDGVIAAVGSGAPEVPAGAGVLDAGGKLVTPGLVDAHTHLVFGGWRQNELALKLRGVPYLDILAQGGGILSTVTATRAASQEELAEKARAALDEMLSFGTTTCEAKSGYGLDKFNQELSELENELDTIAEEKKKAVRKFETETKKVIADELTAECAGELGRLRREHEETYNAQRSAEEQIKSISMVITEKYSPYIGRENMDITLLEQLEQLLQSGEAGTVGEALGVYRSRRETTEQTRA